MRFIFIFLVSLIVISSAQSARADYAVWHDPATGLSLSWPDNWKRVSNADPNDVLTIMAPSGRGHASCRVRADRDERYLVFPSQYDAGIQKFDYSGHFFNKYLAEYDDHEVINLQDGAGLGRGFAGYAIANYESAVQGPYMKRKALVFASLYNDTAYILECSSHRDAFTRWKGLFLSVAGSMNFKKVHHELRSGNYRNFMSDPRILLQPMDRLGDVARTLH